MREKPKIVVLGMFHMRNSNDLIKNDSGNFLSVQRQKEIQHVVDKIANFRPTKVAVEVIKEEHDKLNEDYRQYLDGTFKLKSDEVHQLGFRVAEIQKHKEVYAIDWMHCDEENKSIGDVLEWAKENKPDFYKEIDEKYLSNLSHSNSTMKDQNVMTLMKKVNDKKVSDLLHECYMAIARIGHETDYVGIEWVRWWYERNLIIYSNLASITTSPSDRTLLIIGGSHVHLVSQFLKESGQFEVIDANEYLE